ncbi:MAG: hypothetical protein U1F57_12115 [bacterium]
MPVGESVLSRFSETSLSQSASLSSAQAMVDGLTSRFVEEATRPSALLAMSTGSLFYRFGRIGSLALASRMGAAAPVMRVASYGIGLLSEVSAFEGTSRLFATVAGDRSNPNLWSWNGRGGWREGLASSLVTFGMLKLAGHATQEQNLIFQHLFSDMAMVGGHQVSSAFGWTPRPEGTLAEQLLHAEVTNLQLGLGMGLLHQFSPGLHAFERSLDLSLNAQESTFRSRDRENGSLFLPRFAFASEGFRELVGERAVNEESDPYLDRFGDHVLMMARPPRRKKGGGERPLEALAGRPTVAEKLERLNRQIEDAGQALEAAHRRHEQSIESFSRRVNERPGDTALKRNYEEFKRERERLAAQYSFDPRGLLSPSEGEVPHYRRLEALLATARRATEEIQKAYEVVRRQEVVIELTQVTQQLVGEIDLYEDALQVIRDKLQVKRNNPQLWETYDRLLLRHSLVSRKYQLGGGCLEPGGGAFKYEVSRLERILESLQRTARESEAFYEELNIEIPPTPSSRGYIQPKNYEEVVRMLRNSGLDSSLVRRLIKRIPSLRQKNQLMLTGLEGLNSLIHGRARDERLPVVSLLERIATEEASESGGNGRETMTTSDTLRELLILTHHFQVGLLGRDEVLRVVRETNDFHQSYPEARGPFIELFARKHLVDSKQSMLVDPILDFARTRLERGDKVFLEPRDSIGYANLRVETSTGERMRYAGGRILREVQDIHDFSEVSYRMVRNLILAQERDVKTVSRIYIDLAKVGRDITPERIRFWATRLLERGPRLVLDDIIEEAATDHHRNLPVSERTREAMAGAREFNRFYWESLRWNLDQVEIAYVGEDGQRRAEVVRYDPRLPSKAMIAEVQMRVSRLREAKDPRLMEEVLLLANLFRDAGRADEAIQSLQEKGANAYPNKRIRDLYRNLYIESLKNGIERSRENEIHSPSILRLLQVFFNSDIVEKDLREFTTLHHPDFDFGRIRVARDEDALSITFPVVSTFLPGKEVGVGEFVVEISIPKNESRFVARIARAGIAGSSSGKGGGVFVIERILSLLGALNIGEVQLEAENMGRYSWLRMGWTFVQDHERFMYATSLKSFIESNHITGIRPFDPHRVTAHELAEILSRFPRKKREEFVDQVYSLPHLRFSLKDDSIEWRNFVAYFTARRDQVLRMRDVN